MRTGCHSLIVRALVTIASGPDCKGWWLSCCCSSVVRALVTIASGSDCKGW